MAIRPGGTGDISKSHVEWHVATGAPYVTSLVYYRGTVFMVNGRGMATAVDLLQAEARAVDMRTRSIDARASYLIAVARLEFVGS